MNNAAQDNILEITDLAVSLRGNILISDINLQLKPGQIHAVTGPNGAGKTTLIRSILGEMPHTGRIRFLFRESGRIGYVPQVLEFDHAVPITVFDFLFLMLKKTPVFLGRRGAVRGKIQAILSATDCEHLIDSWIGQLSGGEFRRVLLAQALEPKPEILLLDEPASNIDEKGLHLFEQMLLELKKTISILMVSHHRDMILRVADHLTVINKNIIYDGSPVAARETDIYAAAKQ